MPNPWIEHVKNWSKANNVSYGCSISLPECKEAYQKKKKKANLDMAKKPASIRNAFPKRKTTVPEQPPKITGKVTKEQIDKMKKEIDALVDKAGKIAEREGKVTAEVSKLLEKKNKLMMKRLMLVKEYKKQQKS